MKPYCEALYTTGTIAEVAQTNTDVQTYPPSILLRRKPSDEAPNSGLQLFR